MIGEVGDKGPSPLWMLDPLDVGWFMGDGRRSRLLGEFECDGRGSFLGCRGFWHLIHTVVRDGSRQRDTGDEVGG